jgi:hypothetical protein
MSKGGNFEWVDCCDCMVLLFYFILLLAQMKGFIAKFKKKVLIVLYAKANL